MRSARHHVSSHDGAFFYLLREVNMNTGNDIVNMLKCRRGEHCLFRSFGLGAITDQVGKLRKGQIVQELAKWYPQITDVNITIRGDEYIVKVRGVGE